MCSRFSLDRGPATLQNRDVIRAAFNHAAILVATIPALVRSQREQAIVELAPIARALRPPRRILRLLEERGVDGEDDPVAGDDPLMAPEWPRRRAS